MTLKTKCPCMQRGIGCPTDRHDLHLSRSASAVQGISRARQPQTGLASLIRLWRQRPRARGSPSFILAKSFRSTDSAPLPISRCDKTHQGITRAVNSKGSWSVMTPLSFTDMPPLKTAPLQVVECERLADARLPHRLSRMARATALRRATATSFASLCRIASHRLTLRLMGAGARKTRNVRTRHSLGHVRLP